MTVLLVSNYPAGKDCQAYDVIISSKFFDGTEVHTYGTNESRMSQDVCVKHTPVHAVITIN